MPTSDPLPVPALLRLLALTRQLAAPNNTPELLRLIIDAGRDILGAEKGSLLLYDAVREELQPGAQRGSVGHYLVEPSPPRASSRRARTVVGATTEYGLAGACARSRRTINVPDVDQDPRYNAKIDHATGEHARSILSVPLLARDEELIGVLQLSNPARGSFDVGDENVAAVLAGHAAGAIQHERLLAEQLLRLKLERDLEAARSIQEGVLPNELPTRQGYSIAAWSRPAEQTGGDLYDVISMGPTTHSPVALLLADASGHGIAPALSVVQVRAMLRVGLRLGATLADLVRQIDAQLLQDLADDQFVTAFVGCLDPVCHQLLYHSAGQGPLLHYHAAQDEAEWRGASALPLGVGASRQKSILPRMQLELGDYVVLLTDGFYECENARGVPFGRARVAEVTANNRCRGARDVLAALVREVDDHADGHDQCDDLTAIIVHRHEQDPAS